MCQPTIIRTGRKFSSGVQKSVLVRACIRVIVCSLAHTHFVLYSSV